jgi:hypothetical protein
LKVAVIIRFFAGSVTPRGGEKKQQGVMALLS